MTEKEDNEGQVNLSILLILLIGCIVVVSPLMISRCIFGLFNVDRIASGQGYEYIILPAFNTTGATVAFIFAFFIRRKSL